MRSIVVAPHPDDEVLGTGGTVLRRKAEGGKVAWLIVSAITVESGWSERKVSERAGEIKRVAELFRFDEVFMLELPATRLDQIPMSDIVAKVSDVFKAFEPDEVFVPHRSDVHTDHRIVFDAAAACVKCFRHPSVRRVLAYETISETDFNLLPDHAFQPNYFVDIAAYIERKLDIMSIYQSELGQFPFPRSLEAIRALALLRGASSGFIAAEAFQLLRERQ